MAADGSVFDLPDTQENARVFGYPGSRRGTRAAFPKARLVFWVEAGTHILCDALISPYRRHNRGQVRRLLRSLTPDMLLLWNRGGALVPHSPRNPGHRSPLAGTSAGKRQV
jgi:hypothetical protein